MSEKRPTPKILLSLMRLMNHFAVGNYRRGVRLNGIVLVLTTIGRKSGQPHPTPLQFEEIDGVYYVASARGPQADWFRNVQVDPHVVVQVSERQFSAVAEPITDAARIADFLELRLQRHPKMIGTMLRAEGLPAKYTRADLERFASGKAMVALKPVA
jgi:deazaflavin-dependent oxidoreductase (nitroreductase family)